MRVGDIFVHKSEGLVQLSEIIQMERNGMSSEYYVFLPYFKSKNLSKTMIPADKIDGRIREVIAKEEAENIVKAIDTYSSLVWDDNNKSRKIEFDLIINGGTPEELSKLIYLVLRKEKQLREIKKTISKFDGELLQRAQKVLFGELAYVLDCPLESIPNYYELI